MIRDGVELSRDESLLGIFLIAASYAFGRLCLRLLLYLEKGFPADVDGFFDAPFKPFMFFVQYNNIFVLKRVLTGFEVGINGRVVDS